MSDGAPNGYSILSFDGNQYKVDFKAASRPVDYQMNIIAPENVAQADLAKTKVLVNVFNGSEHSTVQMRLGKGGKWLTLKRKVQPDPSFVALSNAENNAKGKTWRDLPNPKPCPHLWEAMLPAGVAPGTYFLQVRTTDMHKRTFSSSRTIRIE